MSDKDTQFETVIGLEVHAQLQTETKAFCRCPVRFGAAPNSQTCPVCLGLPGALPVLSRQAVACAIRMILAVGGTVGRDSVFARKNYFYPDLPKGYQISQFDRPLGEGGAVDFESEGESFSVGLIRVHLEEDAGKSFHPEGAGAEPWTLVDMNRCGVPLLEIVSRPEIHSPRAASAYLQKVRQIVRYLEICTGNMEEGALRCDANVSLRPAGETVLGVRTEVKNMNSFRSVERALAYEIRRQTEILKSGGRVIQETMLWDERTLSAQPMRSKEESSDYRYFPEPDLLPLAVGEGWIEEIRASLPELPQVRARRLAGDYRIPDYDARVLTDEKAVADYFETVVRHHRDGKRVSNWMMTEVLKVLKEQKIGMAEFRVPPENLAGLLALVADEAISGTAAKHVFEEMVATGRTAAEIVSERGLSQVSDDTALIVLVDEVIAGHPAQVDQYRAGKTRLLGYFVGEAMKRSGGRANPGRLNELLRERLGSDKERDR